MNGGVLVGFNESLVAATEFIESCPFGAMFIGVVSLLAMRVGDLIADVFALIWHKLVRSKLNRGGDTNA